MSDDSPVTLNTKELDRLIKALKNEATKVRIGILGDKNQRSGGSNNATVGAAHEFGTATLPIRSFLRMPITNYLQKYLEKSGAFEENVVKEVVKTGSIGAWLKKIGIVAESIVSEAFDTAGFGAWKPSDMSKKDTQQTLVETQQLRNSITSEVTE